MSQAGRESNAHPAFGSALAAVVSLLAPNVEIIVNVRAHLIEPPWQGFLVRVPDWWIRVTRRTPPS